MPSPNNHLFGTLDQERVKLNTLAEEQRKKAGQNVAMALVSMYPPHKKLEIEQTLDSLKKDAKRSKRHKH